jgi:rsbT co-antagonist protein RsbR
MNWLLTIHTRAGDPLLLRRARSLAMLTIALVGISILAVLVEPLFSDTFDGLVVNGIAIPLFGAVFLINRSGRLMLAISIMLIGLLILPIFSAAMLGSPIPTIFFVGVTVVAAAAFGGPRAPLIWALIASGIPFAINLVLYGSVVPPSGPIRMPNGASGLSILMIELVAVAVYWMLAGISWLASRQLYDSIAESRAATQVALTATDSLIAQQIDLAARNQQLTQARQELEALVAALAVPVVPVADGIGLLPLVGSFDSQRIATVERQALAIVSEQRMRALVIDLSGVTGIQSSDLGGLVRLCAALRLLGVTPVLAGLGAQGALLLSTSELAMPRTAATVQDALSILQL